MKKESPTQTSQLSECFFILDAGFSEAAVTQTSDMQTGRL